MFLKNGFILIFLLLCVSCTTIQSRSGGAVNISLGLRDGHSKISEIKGYKDFYLWGLLPRRQLVLLDEEVKEMGHISGANVHFEEYQTLKSKLIGLISLGMWIRKDYRITAYGLTRENN